MHLLQFFELGCEFLRLQGDFRHLHPGADYLERLAAGQHGGHHIDAHLNLFPDPFPGDGIQTVPVVAGIDDEQGLVVALAAAFAPVTAIAAAGFDHRLVAAFADRQLQHRNRRLRLVIDTECLGLVSARRERHDESKDNSQNSNRNRYSHSHPFSAHGRTRCPRCAEPYPLRDRSIAMQPERHMNGDTRP